jgi:sugar phosphate isomerase/epimerase
MNELMDFSRLSLNQITTQRLNLRKAAELCVRHGIPAIGVWRDKVCEIGLSKSVKTIRDAGVKVSSLCRGGFFPASSSEERFKKINDNLRAIDEASELGTNLLVLVCGGLNDCEIGDARKMIADGIAAISTHAAAAGIKLGIEPLHPMFAADRSVICTLREANNLAETFAPEVVGVIVDVFHVWWDANVYLEIERANKRILGFHVSDWSVPLPDILLSRSMMGDGVITLRRLRRAVENVGYSGPIEVEIFNQGIWDGNPDEVLNLIKDRYLTCV